MPKYRFYRPGNITKTSALLFFFIINLAFGDTEHIFTGDEEDLVSSPAGIIAQFPFWKDNKGYITGKNNPIHQNGQATIDFIGNPDKPVMFIIGGYTEANNPIENNSLNLINGQAALVYGGFSYFTQFDNLGTIQNIQITASKNNVKMSEQSSFTSLIFYGGLANSSIIAKSPGANLPNLTDIANIHIKDQLSVTADANIINFNKPQELISQAIIGAQVNNFLASGQESNNEELIGITQKNSHFSQDLSIIIDQGMLISTSGNIVNVVDPKNLIGLEVIYGGISDNQISTGLRSSKKFTYSASENLNSSIAFNNVLQLNTPFVLANNNAIKLDLSKVKDPSQIPNLLGGVIGLRANTSSIPSKYTLDIPNDKQANINIDINNSILMSKSLIEASNNSIELIINKNINDYPSNIITGGSISTDITTVHQWHVYVGNFTNTNNSSIYADTSTDMSINFSGSTVQTNGNRIKLSGEGKFQSEITGGSTVIEFSTPSIDVKEIDVNNGKSSHINAKADNSINLRESIFAANQNSIEIDENITSSGDVTGGSVSINIKKSDITLTANSNPLAGSDLEMNSIIDLSKTSIQANQNTIILSGSNQGNIYGAYVSFEIDGKNITLLNEPTKPLISAINNVITLGTSSESTGGKLYGAYANTTSLNQQIPLSYDLFSGNTLNVNAKKTLYFDEIKNFEKYNFTLTPELANTGTAIIDTNTIIFGNNSGNQSDYDASNSKTYKNSIIRVVGIHSSDKALTENEEFILIQAGNLSGNGSSGQDSITHQIQQGISLIYDVNTTIDYDTNKVITTIKNIYNKPNIATVNPGLKSLGEGRLAMSQLLLRGAENIANNIWGVIQQLDQKGALLPFVDFYAGYSKYMNNATVRSDEYILTLGAAYHSGHWSVVPLIEMGWSDYKSTNNYAGHIRSKGDNNYYGIGFLWGYNNSGTGIYTDGSFRLGHSKNKFNSQDFVHTATGEKASYNLSGKYISAHIGSGYRKQLDSKNLLDFSARLLWTKLYGKNTRVAGDPINLPDINSKRIHLGLEWQHSINTNVNIRANAIYEYEFSQRFNITTYHHYKTDKISLKGGSAILSFGAIMKPSSSSQWSYNIDLAGYTGKRKGAAINFQANYDF